MPFREGFVYLESVDMKNNKAAKLHHFILWRAYKDKG